jgi:hypothetical protein
MHYLTETGIYTLEKLYERLLHHPFGQVLDVIFGHLLSLSCCLFRGCLGPTCCGIDQLRLY